MVAVYTYQAQRDDELSFAVNDIITVVDRSDSDWWHGELRGQIGMFPANYVAAVTQQENVQNDLAVSSTVRRMFLAILCYVNM